MSFFGSLGTAVQAINAQAAAIGHISDNVANATTNGYKQVNTEFSDLVMNKVFGESPVIDSNRHMGVLARADFGNRRQGSILRSDLTTSIAVSGNGFIPVAKPSAVDPLTREPTEFEDTTYYTRLGDFRLDNSNRLVNSSGFYLLAAEVGGTEPDEFIVDDDDIDAVPTSTVNYLANLPGTAVPGQSITTGIGVIDADSNEENFQLIWSNTGANAWNLTINTTDATPNSFGPIAFTFTNGTLTTMTTADANLTLSAAGAATIALNVDYGAGAQAITVNIGQFGGGFDSSATSGITQFSGEDRSISNLNINQNGLRAGVFEYVSFDEIGQIVLNYTNGRSQVGGQLLLANFPEADRLDRVDGTVFLLTEASGDVVYGQPGDPDGDTGVGTIRGGAIEQSTVEISEQMTKLIVAQQAYSLNGQVITASDQMLSRLIDMKR